MPILYDNNGLTSIAKYVIKWHLGYVTFGYKVIAWKNRCICNMLRLVPPSQLIVWVCVTYQISVFSHTGKVVAPSYYLVKCSLSLQLSFAWFCKTKATLIKYKQFYLIIFSLFKSRKHYKSRKQQLQLWYSTESEVQTCSVEDFAANSTCVTWLQTTMSLAR